MEPTTPMLYILIPFGLILIAGLAAGIQLIWVQARLAEAKARLAEANAEIARLRSTN